MREKFKRAVIEAIHGLPYEEAVKEERFVEISEDRIDEISCDVGYFNHEDYIKNYPITIGRVMQALYKVNSDYSFNVGGHLNIFKEDAGMYDMYQQLSIIWKLTKENGQECTDDDQSDETIEKLYNLLNK